MYICTYCEKEFIPRDKKYSKFCSRSCAAKFNNQKRKRPFTKCKNCERDIIRQGYRDEKRKFCSHKCSEEYRKKEYIEKITGIEYEASKTILEQLPKAIIGKCKIHGETKFYRQKDKMRVRYICVKCNIERVTSRRRELKKLAIDYKGGKCYKCGYNKSIRSLVFHHLDPKEKDFAIGHAGYTRSWEKIKIELDKCILVCANCHGELEDEIEGNKQITS